MDSDKFKESFKYFKAKNPPPDLSRAFEIDGDKHKEVLKRISVDTSVLDSSLRSLLQSQWDVFKFLPCPGVILIKNPFTSFGQRYFITQCLLSYTKPPNPTNLQSKHDISLSSQTFFWWDKLNRTSDPKAHKKLREDLRWTTLGYHHDWDKKVYNEKLHNDFPDDLAFFVKGVAKVLQYDNYHPEAAIVNYYPLNATLAGHVDHSEYCNEPLFSISLGQSACFLIGGETRDIEPSALLLQSGDICIFSGKSRLSYHAVPKIIKTEEKRWWTDDERMDETVPDAFDQSILNFIKSRDQWKAFNDYISLCRININVRQVYKAKKEEIT